MVAEATDRDREIRIRINPTSSRLKVNKIQQVWYPP
jgi:hypothetical protein|nr:MAG TPA: hypothetical protein [Caudoviricetes sp.]